MDENNNESKAEEAGHYHYKALNNCKTQPDNWIYQLQGVLNWYYFFSCLHLKAGPDLKQRCGEEPGGMKSHLALNLVFSIISVGNWNLQNPSHPAVANIPDDVAF